LCLQGIFFTSSRSEEKWRCLTLLVIRPLIFLLIVIFIAFRTHDTSTPFFGGNQNSYQPITFLSIGSPA
jgi:uncharacterized integral membrane protein